MERYLDAVGVAEVFEQSVNELSYECITRQVVVALIESVVFEGIPAEIKESPVVQQSWVIIQRKRRSQSLIYRPVSLNRKLLEFGVGMAKPVEVTFLCRERMREVQV